MIGTLRESSLHAALKAWLARPGDQLESPVDGYVADILRGGSLIEIQTRNFAALRRKLPALLEAHPVRLVHPIACEKYIVKLEGRPPKPASRRKSPRRGRAEEVFAELVSLPGLMAHPNFSLTVLLTREDELRQRGRGGSWRRRGWRIADRVLLEVLEAVDFEGPGDCLRFLPPDLPEPFTAGDLARAGHYPSALAGQMCYCLRHMGAIQTAGRKRGGILYLRSNK
jgi:hypothetical protein